MRVVLESPMLVRQAVSHAQRRTDHRPGTPVTPAATLNSSTETNDTELRKVDDIPLQWRLKKPEITCSMNILYGNAGNA